MVYIGLVNVGISQNVQATPPRLAKGLERAFETELSDPDTFTPSDFTLAVHAINPVMRRELLEAIKRNGTYDAKRDVDLLKTPERMREKGILSASILSAQHLSTFGRLLFVVGFGFNDILATSTEDGYVNEKEKMLLERPPGATMSPSQMLGGHNSDHHNELTLKASGTSIEAIGIKAMLRPDGSKDIPEDAERLREIADELDVPFLEIPEKCTLQDSPVTVFKGKAGQIYSANVVHNGAGYIFGGENWNYRYFHSQGKDLEDIPPKDYAAIRPSLAKALSDTPAAQAFFDDLDKRMTPQPVL